MKAKIFWSFKKNLNQNLKSIKLNMKIQKKIDLLKILLQNFIWRKRQIKGPTIELENKSLVPVLSPKKEKKKETLSVAIPHIDFIFGDERKVVRDADLMVQILQLQHSTIRLQIHTNSGYQRKRCNQFLIFISLIIRHQFLILFKEL